MKSAVECLKTLAQYISPKAPAASGLVRYSPKSSEPSEQIARRRSGGPVRSLANVLAPALILLTPLVSFLSYHRYDLWRPESLALIGVFLLLGFAINAVISLRSELLRPAIIGLLLLLFLDMQFRARSIDWPEYLTGLHVASENTAAVLVGGVGLLAIVVLILTWILRRHLGIIVSSVFGVMILSTIVLPSDSIRIGETQHGAATERVNLPPVVHLVLDGHIGLAGLPMDIPGGAELRGDLEAFYERFGFTVFPRAYSQYIKTFESVGNILNGEASSRYGNNVLTVSGKIPGSGIQFRENLWFQTLTERGYRIRIYQTDFLDLCTPDLAAREYCLTVPSNSIYSLMGAELPVESKAWIILGRHLSGSLSISIAKKLLSPLRDKYDLIGDAVDLLSLQPRLGAISAFSVMDRIAEDLRKTEPGTLFFAHLLAPHGAYIFDADCSLKPDIGSWVGPWTEDPPSAINTPATRRTRYPLYFDQIRCTQRKLAQIFDALRDAGLFAESTVIIHGDHGSRISLVAPSNEAIDEISGEDLIDSYSTLFAVRRPDMAAGQDRRQQSISSLFAGIVLNRPQAEEPADVFMDQSIMHPKLGQPYLPKPMPELGN